MIFNVIFAAGRQFPKTRKHCRFFSSVPSDTANNPEHVPAVKIISALDLGCMDYAKSWAWQHVLLSQRLARRREDPSCADADCVLLLEHAPVYTLGRGADETHLTFLLDDDSPECQAMRHQLSRKARGPGTARLSVDRSSDPLTALPLDQALEQLSQLATPVLAPNGAPVYRVDRGGEVTFHGPLQLVVYPLLDLKRPPFEQDLHWYLRMVEEVVIQTLHHYNIDSVRDDENTGT
jgi:lipoate-protein ligase B